MARFLPAREVRIISDNSYYNECVNTIKEKILSAANSGCTNVALTESPFCDWAGSPEHINDHHYYLSPKQRQQMRDAYETGLRILKDLEVAGYTVLKLHVGTHNQQLNISWEDTCTSTTLKNCETNTES